MIDHYSRSVIGFAIFKKHPTADKVKEFMAKAICAVGTAPKHLISDQRKQFISEKFREWCSAKPRNIKQRFGAVGEYGSIAIVERLIRSMKNECTRGILVPLSEEGIRSEITLYINWYNQHRPHQALDGRIPMDVYFGIDDEVLCFETRGEDAVAIRLVVSRLDDRKHLPIVELEHAA